MCRLWWLGLFVHRGRKGCPPGRAVFLSAHFFPSALSVRGHKLSATRPGAASLGRGADRPQLPGRGVRLFWYARAAVRRAGCCSVTLTRAPRTPYLPACIRGQRSHPSYRRAPPPPARRRLRVLSAPCAAQARAPAPPHLISEHCLFCHLTSLGLLKPWHGARPAAARLRALPSTVLPASISGPASIRGPDYPPEYCRTGFLSPRKFVVCLFALLCMMSGPEWFVCAT